ncbi:SRPBCC family protein [Ginsengibacter hankyongi]|uniref:SRPBCC family protein n=1 Tax=Ginsengibacter hankyongi TaxID=2607284 RepID=A0A5J5IKZ6_9BACT|nr:SRPBCC family protein [Ginsengibacter hankyongi]KAA9041043.1 SRPBCC family protein [Ginsengibacter hankyongi]
MPTIYLETKIKSNIQICFDLARSIDLHQISTAKTNEKAVDGKTKGLINLGEYVTWQAKHFGINQRLTSKITRFNEPFYFKDEQQKGAFKYIAHDHYFEKYDQYVIMKDIFNFQSPLGMIGKLVDKILLSNYLKRLLIERNSTIKEYAETEKWKSIFE